MSICDPALRNALRTLKLSGMLDTLDARLAQTRNGDLGHLEFLQALREDEIARRESAALTRRLRRAKFEAQATFEDFDFTANPKLPGAMLRDLAALRWLDAGESVILHGPVGVGKTHVAQALVHAVARRGGDVRFAKTSRMLSDLAGGHADRSWGQRIREPSGWAAGLSGAPRVAPRPPRAAGSSGRWVESLLSPHAPIMAWPQTRMTLPVTAFDAGLAK